MQDFPLKRVAFTPDFRVLRGVVHKGFTVPYKNDSPNDNVAGIVFCVSGKLAGLNEDFTPDPTSPFDPGVGLIPTERINEPKVMVALEADTDYVCICAVDEYKHRTVGGPVTLATGQKLSVKQGQYVYVCTGQLEGIHSKHGLLQVTSGDKELQVTEGGMFCVFYCKDQ